MEKLSTGFCSWSTKRGKASQGMLCMSMSFCHTYSSSGLALAEELVNLLGRLIITDFGSMRGSFHILSTGSSVHLHLYISRRQLPQLALATQTCLCLFMPLGGGGQRPSIISNDYCTALQFFLNRKEMWRRDNKLNSIYPMTTAMHTGSICEWLPSLASRGRASWIRAPQ